ncbi:MAG: ATP-binding cassette domain-containing protein [Candidatus Hydrogenedentota bacterium]|nr:MAG: ATP-binding cassette domain-containing protein [Candidatus Hydrogenedentota bacterium]
MESSQVLTFQDAEIGYSAKSIFTHVNLSFPQNIFCRIHGPNGSGKTTIARTMLGLLRLRKGIMKVYAQKRAYVPQQNKLDRQFPMRLAELVETGFSFSFRQTFSKHQRKHRQEKVLAYLEKSGLAGKQDLLLKEASGGQLQRALIARALIANPDFLVLDEPFSNLDKTGKIEIWDWLLALHKEKQISIFIIDHHETGDLAGYTHELVTDFGSVQLLPIKRRKK